MQSSPIIRQVGVNLVQLPDDVAFDTGDMGKGWRLVVRCTFGMAGIIQCYEFGVIAAQILDSDTEEVRHLLEAGFVRSALTSLPGRPLLGRDILADELGKRFGALLAPASIGKLLQSFRADIGRDGLTQFVRNFSHDLPFLVGRRQIKETALSVVQRTGSGRTP